MPRNQFEATIAVGRFTRLHSCCVGKLTWELRSDIDSLCDELLA